MPSCLVDETLQCHVLHNDRFGHLRTLPHIGHDGCSNIPVWSSRVNLRLCRRHCIPLKQPAPPLGWIHRSMSIVCRRVDVVEEVPHCEFQSAMSHKPTAFPYVLTMSNSNPAQLIFRPMSMQHHVESHQHPRQPRSLEREQSQEAQSRVWIPPRPNVYQRATQRCPQEGLAEQRRDREKGYRCVGQKPAEMRD